GLICKQRGDYLEAKTFLEAYVVIYPWHVDSHVHLAETYLMIGQNQLAKQYLDAALKLDNFEHTVREQLANYYHKTGCFDLAKTSIIHAAILQKTSPIVNFSTTDLILI
ncbi:MAG: Tetratricopeptide repeat protein 7B, partial [Paramarteilia canceri]